MSDTRGWIDAHCHLADPRFDAIRDSALKKSQSLGITSWIQGGVDPADWARQLALKKIWGEAVITSFGLHPWWVVANSRVAIDQAYLELEKQATHASAIGELGLDSSRRLPPAHSEVTDPLSHQIYAFRLQLKLAVRLQKPLVLHILHEHETALKILEKEAISKLSGIVHSYSGSLEQAQRYIALGLTISVSGGVTQKGFPSLKKAVKVLPQGSFVVETDSPDQSPAGAGQLNEPSELIGIAKAVGEIRGESFESVLDQSALQLRRIFNL